VNEKFPESIGIILKILDKTTYKSWTFIEGKKGLGFKSKISRSQVSYAMA